MSANVGASASNQALEPVLLSSNSARAPHLQGPKPSSRAIQVLVRPQKPQDTIPTPPTTGVDGDVVGEVKNSPPTPGYYPSAVEPEVEGLAGPSESVVNLPPQGAAAGTGLEGFMGTDGVPKQNIRGMDAQVEDPAALPGEEYTTVYVPASSTTDAPAPPAKSWKTIALGAAVIFGLGLYFFTLTAVVVALICAFVGVAIAFYFLNGLQYAARSEGNNVTVNGTSSTHVDDEVNRRNCISCICTILGYAFFTGAHVAHIVGMLLIYVAYFMLSLHDEIPCIARVTVCVKACAKCFDAQEVHAARVGTITTIIDKRKWWLY